MTKHIILFLLLSSQIVSAKYKVCKEITGNKVEHISYYDLDGHKIMSVKLYDGNPLLNDTTIFVYKNSLLIKQYHYYKKNQITLKPVDEILRYINSNPEAINYPLLAAIRSSESDTEMTAYFYNRKKQLIREERSLFADSLIPGNQEYYGDFPLTSVIRAWQKKRFTDYKYDSSNRLIGMSGTLEEHPFGRPFDYLNSTKKIFYDSSGRIISDSVLSYNGPVFDGSVSHYAYTDSGYTILYENYDGTEVSKQKCIFQLNKNGQLISEMSYSISKDESNQGFNRFHQENAYEYNKDGSLHTKTTYYNGSTGEKIMYSYE